MHQEAEKVIGRQAQEVGEVRKLADELIKQNLSGRSQPVEQKEPEVDFYEDPQKAIQQTVATHPDVVAARQASLEFKKMQTQQRMAQEHPDFMQVAADPEFHAWVKSSPIRLELYAKADAQFDFDAGNGSVIVSPNGGITIWGVPVVSASWVTDDKETLKNAFQSGQLEFKKIWELE